MKTQQDLTVQHGGREFSTDVWGGRGRLVKPHRAVRLLPCLRHHSVDLSARPQFVTSVLQDKHKSCKMSNKSRHKLNTLFKSSPATPC